jgi:hypothetical protein
MILETGHDLCQHPTGRYHGDIAGHGFVALILKTFFRPSHISPAIGTAEGWDVGVV